MRPAVGMPEPAAIEADLEGSVSPPRDNGEIVFSEPWERRAFGITIALCRTGACEWETFRQALIARINEDGDRPYWHSWSAALEDVLEGATLVSGDELDVRQREFVARPHGHDHAH